MAQNDDISLIDIIRIGRDTVAHWWQTSFLLRWTIANMLGWMLGLLLLVLLLWLLGWLGALLSGAAIGAGIAVPQAYILFPDRVWRLRWVGATVLGTALAMLPVVGLAIVGIFNIWMAALLIGVAFGGVLGWMQAQVLVPMLDDDAYLWIPLTMLAATVAALLLVIVAMLPLSPLIASPATIIYALITGWQLKRWHAPFTDV